jgi:ribose 1,5-bisphosphate isomerase
MPHYTSFQRVIKDIKDLKIQGAEAVSQEGIKSLKIVIHKSKALTVHGFLEEMEKARKQLIKTRPTEPYLRNAINSVYNNWQSGDLRKLKEEVYSKINKTLLSMQNSRKQIIAAGAKKIKKGMVVFTHCHSSTVTAILIEAKKQKKNFTVHNTETRPRLQGRKTAKELAKAGIKVRHYVDSAARLALKKADLMMIGADAITSEGRVINKIGSELFAEIAKRYDIPVYVCTNSWKFDPKTIFGFTEEIEERDPREVWKNPPKNIAVDNHAFEIIDPDIITGVITELGVFEPRVLVGEIKDAYPWLVRR